MNPGTCKTFRSGSQELSICNNGETRAEFAPKQVVDILVNILLSNPCSKAGMDIEFKSGQKQMLFKTTNYKDNAMKERGVTPAKPDFPGLDGHNLTCFNNTVLPLTADCIWLMDTINHTEPKRYMLQAYDILTYVNNTCALHLTNHDETVKHIDKKQMVFNVSQLIFPCLLYGYVGLFENTTYGYQAQLRHVQNPIW